MELIPNLKRKDPAKRNLCVGIGTLSKNTAGHTIQCLMYRVRLIYWLSDIFGQVQFGYISINKIDIGNIAIGYSHVGYMGFGQISDKIH